MPLYSLTEVSNKLYTCHYPLYMLTILIFFKILVDYHGLILALANAAILVSFSKHVHDVHRDAVGFH